VDFDGDNATKQGLVLDTADTSRQDHFLALQWDRIAQRAICGATEDFGGDVVGQLKKLKAQDGPDLWVWGSGNLIQTLLKYDLIDRMHLWIHPITIGSGKRLFAEGTRAQNFKLVDSKIGTTGLIFATYEPAEPLKKS
jgi:riboflavin biosynthesis pyrimidine reductase